MVVIDRFHCINSPGSLHIVRDIVPYNSRPHGHHMIWNDRAAVKEIGFQPSAVSGVDRRTVGDLRYKLGLDHLGFCKPAMRS